MRIALFHSSLPQENRKPGGVDIAVHRLANALLDQGEDVTVFSLGQAPLNARYVHHRLFCNAEFMSSNRFLNLVVLPLALNQVSFDEYDVLHLHGDDWFFLRRSLPTVRTLHGSALEEARTATSWKRRIAQYCLYPLEHLSADLADIAAAVGPGTARLYRTPHIVNNGVDLDLFKPGPKTTYPSVLFVGTWEGRKRGKFLFELFLNEVIPQVPDAKLYVVADRFPVSHEQVKFIDRPSDQEIARLYRESWVFASPSVYEGFGIPYIEAMASATPVVCSPNDGAMHVLENGEYGMICSDRRFGERLRHLLHDQKLRRKMAQRGMGRASDFSWQEVAIQHKDLYQKAVTRFTARV